MALSRAEISKAQRDRKAAGDIVYKRVIPAELEPKLDSVLRGESRIIKIKKVK